MKNGCIGLCIIAVLFFLEVRAQSDDKKSPDDLSWDFDEGGNKDFSVGTFISDKFTPQIILDTKRIREYICDGRFSDITYADTAICVQLMLSI